MNDNTNPTPEQQFQAPPQTNQTALVDPEPNPPQERPYPDATMLNAALELAAEGIPVFPCSPGNKKPFTRSGFKDAKADPEWIRAAWRWHRTAMIGIPTGEPSGLVVLDTDVDVTKGKNGEAELKAMLAELGQELPATRTVKTPRGGFHRYFKWPGSRVPSSADQIASGVDVRGDGGYVIAPPSRTFKGAYEVVDPSEPAALPDWLHELMSATDPVTENAEGETTTITFQMDDGLPVPMEELQDALTAIAADAYDTWLRIGMALRRWHPERGLVLWDAWSRTSGKYVEGDCEAKWPTFGDDYCGSVVTVRSIFHTARKAGWRPKVRDDWEIVLPSDCGWTITQSAAKLFGEVIAPTETMFRRAGLVVEPSPKGFVVVTEDGFRSRVESYGRRVVTLKMVKGAPEKIRKICPKETAKALLAAKEISHLPEIAYVTKCPVTVSTGTGIRVLGEGYHAVNGGVFVDFEGQVPDVDLDEAVAALQALLQDFNFQTPADHSRAIASMLTPAFRFGGWIDGHIPIEIAEADQSQSGKTFRQRMVAAIYNDEPQFLSQRDGGVGSLDESFGQKLLNGRPFILFDNLRGGLKSQVLEAFLTAAGLVGVRVPHRGEVEVDTRRFVVSVTSNGFEATRDLVNRASFVRIRKQPEGYQFAAYPEGNLVNHVKANSHYYLGCVFAVLREWNDQGRPTTDESRHSFKEWARPLDWIVRNLFNGAPLLDDHREAQQRACSPGEGWLRSVAEAVERNGMLNCVLAYADILQICEDDDISIPGVESFGDNTAFPAMGRLAQSAFGKRDNYMTETGIQVWREKHKIYIEDRKEYRDQWGYTFTRD